MEFIVLLGTVHSLDVFKASHRHGVRIQLTALALLFRLAFG